MVDALTRRSWREKLIKAFSFFAFGFGALTFCFEWVHFQPSWGTSSVLYFLGGTFFLFCSILQRPLIVWEAIVEKLVGQKQSLSRAIAVGLPFFLLFQGLAWILLARIPPFKSSHPAWPELSAVVQTAGTISALVFAAFQMLTASAESQYQAAGLLRLEKESALYSYLRLVVSSLLGIVCFSWVIPPQTENSVPLQYALGMYQLISCVVLLIPLVAHLFKSVRPDRIIERNGVEALGSMRSFYGLLLDYYDGFTTFVNNELIVIRFREFTSSTTALGAIGAWAGEKRNIRFIVSLRKHFEVILREWIEFQINLERANGYGHFDRNNLIRELGIDEFLKVIEYTVVMPPKRLRPSAPKQAVVTPPQVEKFTYVTKGNPSLVISSALIASFFRAMCGSLNSSGQGFSMYCEVLDLFVDAVSISDLGVSTKEAVFLNILGESMELILNTDRSARIGNEVLRLELLLEQSRDRLLTLQRKKELAETYAFALMQVKS